jgi:hypothetical protein
LWLQCKGERTRRFASDTPLPHRYDTEKPRRTSYFCTTKHGKNEISSSLGLVTKVDAVLRSALEICKKSSSRYGIRNLPRTPLLVAVRRSWTPLSSAPGSRLLTESSEGALAIGRRAWLGSSLRLGRGSGISRIPLGEISFPGWVDGIALFPSTVALYPSFGPGPFAAGTSVGNWGRLGTGVSVDWDPSPISRLLGLVTKVDTVLRSALEICKKSSSRYGIRNLPRTPLLVAVS